MPKRWLEYVEKYHVSMVGGCCGTTPAHLKLLVDATARPGAIAPAQPGRAAPGFCHPGDRHAAGAAPIPDRRAPEYPGQPKFKQIILAEDFEGALNIARQQVNSGAHGLDLCVALTERADEADT